MQTTWTRLARFFALLHNSLSALLALSVSLSSSLEGGGWEGREGGGRRWGEGEGYGRGRGYGREENGIMEEEERSERKKRDIHD